MTTELVTVHLNTSMLQIKEYFETNHFHHLPVLDDDGKVMGMISRLDYNMILDHFTVFGVAKAERTNERFLGALVAKDILSGKVVKIDAEDSIEEAVRIFLENLFHALPVLDRGKLVGIVTTYDLLKYFVDREDQARLMAGK
jgi:CBS domain-containing protein